MACDSIKVHRRILKVGHVFVTVLALLSSVLSVISGSLSEEESTVMARGQWRKRQLMFYLNRTITD